MRLPSKNTVAQRDARPAAGRESWTQTLSRRLLQGALAMGLTAAATLAPGCAALHPIRGVPVDELALDHLTESRSAKATIDLSLLTQSKPDQYRVGAEDVLSIYVPGVLGTLIDRDDEIGETPPITVPVNSDAPPTVGFPLTVRGDGTLSLPQVDPIRVEGMTLREVEKAIIRAYTVDAKILSAKRPRVIVTLQRPRTYEVLVVRQEKRDEVGAANVGNGVVNVGSSRKGTARLVSLPAYQNDVLHALAAEEVDGLPGLDAENTIYVIRRRGNRAMAAIGASPACGCDPFGAALPGQPMMQPGLTQPSVAPMSTPQTTSPSQLPEPNAVPDAGDDASGEASGDSATHPLPALPRFGEASGPSLPSLSAGANQAASREVVYLSRPSDSLVVPPRLGEPFDAAAAAASLPPVVALPTATLPTRPASPVDEPIHRTSYETTAPSEPPRLRTRSAMQIVPQIRGQYDGELAGLRRDAMPQSMQRERRSVWSRLNPWSKPGPSTASAAPVAGPQVPNALTGPVGLPVDANGRLRYSTTADSAPVRMTPNVASRPLAAAASRVVPAAVQGGTAAAGGVQPVGHSAMGSSTVSAPMMPASAPIVLQGGCPIDGQAWTGFVNGQEMTIENPSVIKIPVRLSPGERPVIRESDVILQDGDIVFIESRSTEVFYTGGLLGGGQYELPRDYDLRLLEALSIAQSPQNVVAGRSPGGSTGLNGDVQYSGSRVVVMRTLPGGSRVPIEISIYDALKHPEEHNITIQPGDFIHVQYTKCEAWVAFIQQNLLEGALIGTAFGAFTQSD